MIEIRRTFNRDRGFKLVETLNGYIFTPETNAHTFFIECVDKVNGLETVVPFEAGSTVSARFLKSDHVTELVEGALDENGAAVVTLPAECYAVPGRFLLTILVAYNSMSVCVYAATGTVIAADSSTVNVSENASREIDEKIAELNAAAAQVNSAISAAAAARESIPQDYTALSDSVRGLKGAVGSLQNSYLTSLDFEQGSWGYATPTTPTSTNHYKRIRSKVLYPVRAGMIVEFCLPTLQHYFALLSSLSDTAWASGSEPWTNNSGRETPFNSVFRYTVPSDGYLGIILRKDADATDTSPSDFSGFIRILTQDMADLLDARYDLDHRLDGVCTLKSADFVAGMFNYAGYGRSGTRIRTERLIHVPKGAEVHYGTTGHEIYLGVLTSRSDFNGSPGYSGNQTGWISGKGVYSVPFDGYLSVMERTANDAAPLAPEGFSSNITIVYPEYKRFEQSMIKDQAGPSKRAYVKCSAAMPVIRLSADVLPNQSGSGNPSPDNVRAITPRTGASLIKFGKNICSMQAIYGSTATYAWNDDNTKVTMTSKSDVTFSSLNFGSYKFLANTTYTLSCRVKVLERTSYACKIAFRAAESPYPPYAQALFPSGSDEQIVSCTWTPAEEITASISVMLTDQNAGAASVEISDVQVEQGSVRTDYEPYKRDTISLTLPEACYGARIDADGYGNYQFTRTHVLFSTENISKNSISSVGPDANDCTRFWIYTGYPFYGAPWHCCNSLPYNGNYKTTGKETGYYTSDTYQTSLCIVMPASLVGGTQDSVYDYLRAHPLQFAAPLSAAAQTDLGVVVARPFETSGGDHMIIFGDGDVTVEYYADPSLKIAQLTALILNA